jgi:ABC-type nitrate/sulfonate/bicarbonate transport system permease component
MFAVFVLLTLIGLALYGAVALVERVVLARGAGTVGARGGGGGRRW